MTSLRHAHTVLASLAAAERELAGIVPRTELVRLGVFMSAGAAILPAALAHLTAADPQITVTTSEGTTPALIRALRAGSPDLAVLTSRPPHRPFDGDSPRLHVETVTDTELVVAVPSTGEFAGRTTVQSTSWSTPRGSPPRHRALSRCSASGPACPDGLASSTPRATG
ncbi:LysR substrate-binding domain-containing protein [Streptomyces asiaticus]